jgi:DNA topoisomerase I
VPRLRRTVCSGPGILRKRRGRGFAYYYSTDGSRVTDPDTLARIEALVLPPAWTDVWICPYRNGHIQALGTDAAGRRQYRYHDFWREQRDKAKHDRVLEFAARLPAARDRVNANLAGRELSRERVLAAAVRLLDLGFFRIGSEEYAETNQTYGLATMRREHVSVEGDVITFDYTAKGGKHRIQSVGDPAVREVVQALLKRHGGGEELLAYQVDRQWYDVSSDDINVHLHLLLGGEFTAKDFRTWNATVLAAVCLAVAQPAAASPTGRKRAISNAVREVAHYLGNTPAVCRASYIDPRVIDLYEDGVTIADDLDRLGDGAMFGQLATQGPIEQAVLQLLSEPPVRRVRRAS